MITGNLSDLKQELKNLLSEANAGDIADDTVPASREGGIPVVLEYSGHNLAKALAVRNLWAFLETGGLAEMED